MASAYFLACMPIGALIHWWLLDLFNPTRMRDLLAVTVLAFILALVWPLTLMGVAVAWAGREFKEHNERAYA